MFGRLWRELTLLFGRDRATNELEEEMRFHRALRAEALEREGRSPNAAREEAIRRFGNATRAAEESRDAWGWGSVDELWQDVRYATRRLRQRPQFTLAVFGILALGTGATTAMFSAVDAAFLRPLPFHEPRELVTLPRVNVPSGMRYPGGRVPRPSFDITTVRAMRETFAGVAAYASGGLNYTNPDRPRRVSVGVVSGDFFSVLGVQALRGRPIAPADGTPESPNVAVLSWTMWQSDFGGADVIGQHIPLNSRTYEVVGIMPRGFVFPGESDLWIPLTIPATSATYEPFRGYLPSSTVARTQPGVSLEVANARMLDAWQRHSASFERIAGQRLSVDETIEFVRANGAAVALRQQLVGNRRTALLVLFGATTILLLITCANVTNLLLSYGASRARELAVRAVLGASRARVIRQLLVESLLLAGGGMLLGIAIAPVLLGALRVLTPAELAAVAPPKLDLRVLGFSAAIALTTGLAFGIWPALRGTRIRPTEAIKSGGGHGASASGSRRAQRLLVTAEVALAVVLLVGAGLMLRSFQRLVTTDAGLNPEQVATVELSFMRGTPHHVRLERLSAILDRIRARQGVIAAGAVNDLPLRGGGGIGISVTVQGAPRGASSVFPRYLIASEGYFEALTIQLKRGRSFTPADGTDSTVRVAVISESFAATFWPDVDPIGRTFLFGGEEPGYAVIGVVSDVREASLEQEPTPQMYLPIRSNLDMNTAIVVRGTLRPSDLLGAITQSVRATDATQPVYNLRMMSDVMGRSIAPRRANTILISLFAGLALFIAALGVYAVTANAVARRTREFGIRAALGATWRDLLVQVSTETAVMVSLGVTLGAMLAWGAARVMTGLVYGVDIHDAGSFAFGPAALVVVAIAATIVPARRAMRVEPAEVMRAE
jgi:putative ABC transport system permease protein